MKKNYYSDKHKHRFLQLLLNVSGILTHKAHIMYMYIYTQTYVSELRSNYDFLKYQHCIPT